MYANESQLNRKKSNIFSICQATWDKNRKKFYELNKADELKCCFDRCNEPLQTCIKFCDNTFTDNVNKESCKSTCNKQKILCQDGCKAYVDFDQNPFVECVKQSDCYRSNFTITPTCVQQNKNDLIQCCLNSCIQSNDYDCDELCEFTANVLTNSEPKTFDKPTQIMAVPKPKNHSFKTIVLVLLFIFLIVLIIVTRKRLSSQLVEY